MFDFTDEQKMIRQMIRKYVQSELVPVLVKIEAEEIPPFEAMRKMANTFGLPAMAKAAFERLEKKESEGNKDDKKSDGLDEMSRDPALGEIMMIELSRESPGFAMSLGATVGLAGGPIMRKGTFRQKKKYALPLFTFEKIGAWGMTEPGAGSDAFGGMRTVAKPDGKGGYVINGSKTFITNAPYADIFVIYAKIDHGDDTPMRERPIHAFLLEKDTPGLTVSKPMEKMGMWASPTGEVFLSDVHATKEQLLGEIEKEPSREGARDVFHGERTGAAAMALGIIERCLEDSIKYCKQRTTWEKPIGDYQLIQEKITRMFMHRENVHHILFKEIWSQKKGIKVPMEEASVWKLYCGRAATECAMEAVQLMGGNGYMREYKVEQLARDAKLMQIGGGCDEIQIITIAKALIKKDWKG